MAGIQGYDFKSPDDVKLYLKNLLTEYQFGCYSEKNPEVCHLLGDYYEVIGKEIEKAGEIYKNNCDNLEYKRSCTKYGGYSVVGKGCDLDKNRAYQYMKRGCQLGDPVGCGNAGILAMTNLDVRIDDVKAPISMLAQACNLAQEKACFFLSQIYLRGVEDDIENRDPMSQSLVKAHEFATKSCDLGNFQACKLVSKMWARGEGTQKDMDKADYYRKRGTDIERQMKYFRNGVKFGLGTDR